MNRDFVYILKEDFCYVKDGNMTTFNSQFLNNYIKKSNEIHLRNVWKKSGEGYKFMHGNSSLFDEMGQSYTVNGMINGICKNSKTNRLIYSSHIEQLSGIYEINLESINEKENIILQDNKKSFYNLDVNIQNGNIAVSVSDMSFERHIACIPCGTSSLRTFTDGQTVDNNPHWSRFEKDTIYYDSKGIGFDQNGNISGFGNSSIYKLDLTDGSLTEVACDEKYDYLMPRTDVNGNIYFIRHPKNEHLNSSISFMEVVSIPFKILKAVVNFIEFFTIRYSGEAFKSRGGNPAKIKQSSPKEVFLLGNLIKAEKTLKENIKAGEKYPGFAPRTWELICMDVNGNISVLKKGVVSYDVSPSGEIIYSNGSHIVQMFKESKEVCLRKTDLIEKICLFYND